MLTQIFHLSPYSNFCLPVSHLNSRSSMQRCPSLLSLQLVLFRKRNLLSLLPAFFFLFPFLLLRLHWLTSTSLSFKVQASYASLPASVVFTLDFFSKKKGSVIVARFLYILPFFSIASPGLFNTNLWPSLFHTFISFSNLVLPIIYPNRLTSTSHLFCFTLYLLFNLLLLAVTMSCTSCHTVKLIFDTHLASFYFK